MATEEATRTPLDPARPDDRLEGVERAAESEDGTDLSASEQASATAWFMSDEMEATASADLPINVAPAGQSERLVTFKIQVVGRERISEIRKMATRANASGNDEVNDLEANLNIAAEGLLEPDLSKAENRVVKTRNPQTGKVDVNTFLSAADALSARFAYKPGLIDQIAGAIVRISGYDDNDVKEIRAAGN